MPPDIINEETSTDVSAQELDNVTLSCKATGHPPPKITWKREDHEQMLLKKIGGRDFYKGETFFIKKGNNGVSRSPDHIISYRGPYGPLPYINTLRARPYFVLAH